MKKHQTMLVSLGICSVLLIGALSGCGVQEENANSSDSSSESNISNSSGESDEVLYENELSPADVSVYTDFAVRLFRESLEAEKNTLISPLSVINALAMAANGAKGETLSQIENLFGTDITSLSEFLRDYNASLPAGEKYKLHTANSIWLTDDDDFTVDENFLQTGSSLFNAEVYRTAFDASALQEINQWVSENTDDMISEILNEIPDNTVMYLINALAFDAQWQTPYESYTVRNNIFTMEDGTELTVEMMYSTEDILLQDFNEDNELAAQGFIKYYADEKYALAVLLPEEGTSIADYAASMSGEHLSEILSEASDSQIEAGLPKFETEYFVEMDDILINLGITDAFNPYKADFSGIGSYSDGNFYISRVLHKTYIAVDGEGTRAGASTAVEVQERSMESLDNVRIILNRPFVYMIIDCEENLPLFMGTVMEP